MTANQQNANLMPESPQTSPLPTTVHAADSPRANLLVYGEPLLLPDGTPVLVRPIRPDDEPMMVQFHKLLSPETVHNRYFAPLKLEVRTEHNRLHRVCRNNPPQSLALVAQHYNLETNHFEIIGVGRIERIDNTDAAEIAIVIADGWGHHHLGTVLLEQLKRVAADWAVFELFCDILPSNVEMQRLCESFGFSIQRSAGEPVVRAIWPGPSQKKVGEE